MIKLSLTDKELEELLKQYYKEYEGIDAEVHFSPETTYEGLYETKSIEPRVRITRMMNIMGRERKVEETKSKSNIIKCLNTALSKDGYSLEGMILHQSSDRGITSNSIELNVKPISKGKVKVYETNSTRQY